MAVGAARIECSNILEAPEVYKMYLRSPPALTLIVANVKPFSNEYFFGHCIFLSVVFENKYDRSAYFFFCHSYSFVCRLFPSVFCDRVRIE